MMPPVTMAMNKTSNLGFTTLLSITIEGKLSAVTAIMKDNTVPKPAPFAKRLSATGMEPKISP